MNNQLFRQFQNVASVGTVIEVDAPAWKMRLKIDKNETDWIPIPAMAAGVVSIWRCPSPGEQFSLSAQGGELTSAIPQISLFSENNPPPSTNPDEVFVQLGEHSFSVNIKTGEAIFKLKKCTFDIQETVFTGSVHANKDITSASDIIAKTVSLFKHIHLFVRSGNDNSGGPKP
ncbi:phage baseplate assembly protein V [Acinetobacter sp. WZC-1]|uniref:phage baseplate assembly protein V n=1 Tax=Acinetobacter sp. WZC-1 TaxID=3459034 RepID=UPI00403DDDA3